MALTLQASGQVNTVHPLLKGVQDQKYIHTAGTGYFYHLHATGITQSHRTCQVRSAVSSMLTTECDNLRLKSVRCNLRHIRYPPCDYILTYLFAYVRRQYLNGDGSIFPRTIRSIPRIHNFYT